MSSGDFSIRGVRRTLVPLAGLLLLAACGGGGTLVAGGGTGGTGISTGVMTVGSVIVNGVRFDDNLATVTIDDSPGSTAALRDGMVVTVRGTFNDDGLTGQADAIEVENEVRGPVSAVGTDNLTVLGQAVLVNGATVFANVAGVDAIPLDARVEVHGLRRAADGVIVASRVELVTGAGLVDELRGTVTLLNSQARTFSIGAQQVNYAAAQVLPAGASIDNGTLVEVRGSLTGGVLVAGTVDVEDEEDVGFRPTAGEKFEVEGFVSGYTSLLATFSVGGQLVDGSTARIKGGLPLNLRNGIIVEAKGSFSGGVLVATEIELEDFVEIDATMTTKGSSSFSVLGNVTVLVTGQTVQSPPNFFEAAVAGDTRVALRAFENLDGTLTALELEAGEPDDILQGIVTEPINPTSSLTILGITVDTTSTPLLTGFRDDRDDGDQFITPEQFYGSLVAGQTIVKAKGTFNAGTNTFAATLEIELE